MLPQDLIRQPGPPAIRSVNANVQGERQIAIPGWSLVLPVSRTEAKLEPVDLEDSLRLEPDVGRAHTSGTVHRITALQLSIEPKSDIVLAGESLHDRHGRAIVFIAADEHRLRRYSQDCLCTTRSLVTGSPDQSHGKGDEYVCHRLLIFYAAPSLTHLRLLRRDCFAIFPRRRRCCLFFSSHLALMLPPDLV